MRKLKRLQRPDWEIGLLLALEEVTRRMFRFTGWGDECDEDAAKAVRDVETVLDVIENVRKLIPVNHSSEVQP